MGDKTESSISRLRMPFRVAIATTVDPLIVLPKLRAFCDTISEIVNRPATGHLMVSYEELERGAEADGFELMWLPPLIALSLVPKRKARAVAIPVREGQTSYATALFTKPQGGLRDLDSLRGKRAAWVDEHSCAGYVLPRALLKSRGIDPDETLREQQMVGSHDKVVAQVLRGEADLGATFVHLEDGEIVSAAWGDEKVEVLASYGPIPADMLAFGSRLDEKKRAALTEQLMDESSALSGKARELMDCEAFAIPESSHLTALERLVDDGTDDGDGNG
jgi:phosphonate transport system substrate-binding protein